MKAQPGPMVSGSHFFPKAPLLWVKWMPAWAVMSRNVMCSCAWLAVTNTKGITHHRDTEAQRQADKEFFFKVCITVGPRKSRWCGMLPGFARRDGRMRPSLRGSWLRRESWSRLPLGVWLVRYSRLAAGPTCARGYSDVH